MVMASNIYALFSISSRIVVLNFQDFMVQSSRISSICGFLFGRTVQSTSSATKLSFYEKNRQYCTVRLSFMLLASKNG